MKLHVVAGVLLFFIAGCAKAQDDAIVARAGKLQLTRDEVVASIDYTSPEDSLTVSAIYIEDWKDLAALYQRALEEDIDKDRDTRILVEKATRHIIVQRFVDRMLKNAEKKGLFTIDSSAARAFYHEFPDAFINRETEYAVSRYFASTVQAASRIENALRLHEGDEQSLQEMIASIEPDYAAENRLARSHEQRLRSLAQVHPENKKMRALLQNLPPGELSPVIAVHDSLFVVMEMHDIVRKGEKKSLEQAYGQIEELLTVQQQKQYYSTLLEEAREKYQ